MGLVGEAITRHGRPHQRSPEVIPDGRENVVRHGVQKIVLYHHTNMLACGVPSGKRLSHSAGQGQTGLIPNVAQQQAGQVSSVRTDEGKLDPDAPRPRERRNWSYPAQFRQSVAGRRQRAIPRPARR